MKKSKKSKSGAPTELVCVIDRSGSMSSCLADAQGGFDAFIASQKALDAPCNLTVNQFDTEFDTPIMRGPIKDAPGYLLQPRGMTALWDAVGRTIRQLDADKPAGSVIVLIVTDGAENSSHEFKAADVRDLIKAREAEGWQFSFVGVGVDAFADGGAIGVNHDSTFTAANFNEAYFVMDCAVSEARTTGSALHYDETP